VNNGDSLHISSDRGSITLPASIVDINDDSVWVPRNSLNSQVIPTLGFTYGVVTVVKA
jgi:NADH-quinone oxidoreductase subunit G